MKQEEATEATKRLLVAMQSAREQEVALAIDFMQNMKKEIMMLRATDTELETAKQQLASQSATHATALAEVQKQADP